MYTKQTVEKKFTFYCAVVFAAPVPCPCPCPPPSPVSVPLLPNMRIGPNVLPLSLLILNTDSLVLLAGSVLVSH
jgi:hypothetical protein